MLSLWTHIATPTAPTLDSVDAEPFLHHCTFYRTAPQQILEEASDLKIRFSQSRTVLLKGCVEFCCVRGCVQPLGLQARTRGSQGDVFLTLSEMLCSSPPSSSGSESPDGSIWNLSPNSAVRLLLLAARAIVAIENPADVSVISSRNTGQGRTEVCCCHWSHSNCCCFTPGTFTNQIQAAFREPRLLVVTDPRADHQPLTEASYVNLPTIALCHTDSPLRYVDIAIPCNKGAHSVGLMRWMLAQEVLHMRGTIREHPWEVMPDLYFYRDPEETEKEEQGAAEEAVTKEEFQDEWTAPAPEFTDSQPEVADWSEGVQVASVPIQQFPTEDWSTQPATEDWSAAPTAQATEWVAATTEWS
ncbi:small ribosomal subunit protein uS2-like [Saimiri boliviensis]|uniref:small ribosomal subunit protein uS2-like n=1 Tax=Saimiri boliviensis TaxID=27679 RepID=UPI003D784439